MMATYSEQVLADGAIAYWRLDEASGNVANSKVGNYPGTISGGVTLSQPGALSDGNKAMGFDGSSGKIVVANGPYSAFGVGPATVECWIKTANSTDYIFPVHMTNGAGITIAVSSGRINVQVYPNGTLNNMDGSGIISDNQWHHISVVVTRGATDKAFLYQDGVLDTSITLSATGGTLTTTQPLVIGTHRAAALWFPGQIDEVAIYPTALTPAQITAHYTLRTATAGPPIFSDLKFRWCRFVRTKDWRRKGA